MANAQHSRSSGHGNTQDEVNLEIDDSQSMRQLEEGHQPPILVLSRDTNLVETVKKAAPRGVPVAKYDLQEYWLDIGRLSDYEKVSDIYTTHFREHP